MYVKLCAVGKKVETSIECSIWLRMSILMLTTWNLFYHQKENFSWIFSCRQIKLIMYKWNTSIFLITLRYLGMIWIHVPVCLRTFFADELIHELQISLWSIQIFNILLIKYVRDTSFWISHKGHAIEIQILLPSWCWGGPSF